MKGTVEGQVDSGRMRQRISCSSPVVDPVVQLEEAQLCAALFQAQSQLLHIAPAVIHGAVPPVPDAAGERGSVRDGPALQEPGSHASWGKETLGELTLQALPLCSPEQVWCGVGPHLRAVVDSTPPANAVVAGAETA